MQKQRGKHKKCFDTILPAVTEHQGEQTFELTTKSLVGYLQEVIVAPPIILCAMTKGVFNILIFFSETTSRWRLILCHYVL